MVRIVDYKTYQNDDGEDFFVLVVQGGLAAVKSKVSGKVYLTKQTARVSCTFDEETCKSLIGTEIPGQIRKMEVEPFEYTDEETGELRVINFRNQFISEEEAVLFDNIQEEETVM